MASEWAQVRASLKEATRKYSEDPTMPRKAEAFRKQHGVLSEIEMMKSFTV
ncbi:MAG: hypothetical protein ACQCN3_09715 [Candidatus Bathyarchaeia archaeon]|jgi:hypothetical protein